MPREFLALNPEMCHKKLFANLLTSILFLHYYYCVVFFFKISDDSRS